MDARHTDCSICGYLPPSLRPAHFPSFSDLSFAGRLPGVACHVAARGREARVSVHRPCVLDLHGNSTPCPRCRVSCCFFGLATMRAVRQPTQPAMTLLVSPSTLPPFVNTSHRRQHGGTTPGDDSYPHSHELTGGLRAGAPVPTHVPSGRGDHRPRHWSVGCSAGGGESSHHARHRRGRLRRRRASRAPHPRNPPLLPQSGAFLQLPA